jgi:hypothetical protein
VKLLTPEPKVKMEAPVGAETYASASLDDRRGRRRQGCGLVVVNEYDHHRGLCCLDGSQDLRRRRRLQRGHGLHGRRSGLHRQGRAAGAVRLVATKSAEAACAVAATTVAAGTVATTDVPAFPITATIGAARCTVVVAFKQVKNPGQKPRHRFFLTFCLQDFYRSLSSPLSVETKC